MAQRVTDATEPRRRRWYPWKEWTDGSVWRAKEGDDFNCSPASFQTALHLRARQQGLKVTTGSPEPGIVEFQFTEPEKEEDTDRDSDVPLGANDPDTQ